MFENDSLLRTFMTVRAIEIFIKRHVLHMLSALILSLRPIDDFVSDGYWGWNIAWLQAWYIGAMILLAVAAVTFMAFDLMHDDDACDHEQYKKAWLKVYVLSVLVLVGWLAEGVGYEVAWLFQLIAMTGILFSPLLVGPMLFARIGDPRQGMIVGR
ncbi:MAG: hypothetical protein HGA38_01625 [Candidatus Moranbacteria bacterium]|nr:hypothetical protein [Candidatus Moranbacteria bacterium]